MSPDRRPNHLAAEKSPYLQEHVNNPVGWFPWSEEAFKRARNDGKPIFLSIGYSTCHWCHQMRKESFEDERTAAFINRNFIPIKVDREERPEVDAYYMSAVQAMTGGGGWPLTVFLTPGLKPFYGGTYFPPEPRYGMPSFMQVLQSVANLWKTSRDEVMSNSEQVTAAITPRAAGEGRELSTSALDDCYAALISSFDDAHGGFGTAPKFPLPGTLSFLLRYHHRSGKDLPLRAVLKTLDEMMAGGIRDHVGGGFHRYSTDRVWLVPHFEKMLYDNASLARLYSEAYQITKKDGYAEVARETLGWIVGEMKAEEGGFYSAQDADTEQGEGVYYTWTPGELEAALGVEAARDFGKIFGVTRNGNYEGRTLLHLEPGSALSREEKELVAKSKATLRSARLGRPRPATDTKIMTSWNGLAISALAFSGMVLDDGGLVQEAAGAAEFILRTNSKDGRLLRRYAGGEAGLEGTLEDHAFFVQGLLDLFEADPDPRWLGEAIRLTRVMVEDFEDRSEGGFYLSLGAEPVRLKESYDGPSPSGNSVAALNLVRLAEITGRTEFRTSAERTLKHFADELDRQPSGHTTLVSALDLFLNGVLEVVITAPTREATLEMKAEVFRGYIPDRVILTATSDTYGALSKASTLLEGREPGSGPRAYVCRNFTCRVPVDSADALKSQLRERKG